MSSNASADSASTKHVAKQISRIFLMAGCSPFSNSDCGPTPQSFSAGNSPQGTDPGCLEAGELYHIETRELSVQNLVNSHFSQQPREARRPQFVFSLTFARNDSTFVRVW